MPADDKIADAVRTALVKEGWAITADPLTIEYEDLFVFVDLAGERGAERIAVEIKSFPSRSLVADLHAAVGQYMVYRTLLRETDPDHTLFLAVAADVYDKLMRRAAVRLVLTTLRIPTLVIDAETEEVVSWTRY